MTSCLRCPGGDKPWRRRSGAALSQTQRMVGRVAGIAGRVGHGEVLGVRGAVQLKPPKELQSGVHTVSGVSQPHEPSASLSLTPSSGKWDLGDADRHSACLLLASCRARKPRHMLMWSRLLQQQLSVHPESAPPPQAPCVRWSHGGPASGSLPCTSQGVVSTVQALAALIFIHSPEHPWGPLSAPRQLWQELCKQRAEAEQ